MWRNREVDEYGLEKKKPPQENENKRRMAGFPLMQSRISFDSSVEGKGKDLRWYLLLENGSHAHCAISIIKRRQQGQCFKVI